MEPTRAIADHSLATQTLLSDAKNYNSWIFQRIEPFLGQRILDIGCAIGNITEFFLNRQCVVGLDCDMATVEQIRTRFARHSNFTAHCVDFPTGDLSFLRSLRFDTITCLNVLEHIGDDVGALSTMRSLLAGGGRLILLVPALGWLYGSMDAADGHHRRYSTGELQEKLARAHFRVLSLRYMNFLGVFGWFINGRIRKVPLIPRRQLVFYDRVVPFMQGIERLVRIPFGQSLVAIAE